MSAMEEGIQLPSDGLVWHELMSPNPQESVDFYGQVAGVTATSIGDDAQPYLLLLLAGGKPVGGVAGPRPGENTWPSGGPEAHWIAYFGTDDIDAAVAKAEELGATVLLATVEVPGMGRAAVVRDPQGAGFGLFEPAARAT